MQRTWLIGAGESCDIRVDSLVVSRRHCRLIRDDAGWAIEDLGSTNGTFVNGVQLSGSRRISADDAITLGRALPLPWPDDPMATAAPNGPRPLPSLPLPNAGKPSVVGRSAGCDVVLDFPMVSGRHAVIERGGESWHLRDLGSTNGTYVAGRRIDGVVAVGPGEIIGLGSHRVVLVAPGVASGTLATGEGATIEVRDLAVAAMGRRLIEDVSLVVRPGELVGVMGPSGAGKSTLLAALAGSLRPSAGSVRMGGVDVAARYDEVRGQIGYVPQDDIMHAELTVGQALGYAARLRLPRDYSSAEIQRRVDRVLDQLGLTDVAHSRIGTAERRGISGGQRKRVNVALELITDPPILLLDEPTSGLSSTDALSLMRLLRRLANEGKTVILTIHQPGVPSLELMDALAVVARDSSTGEVGRLVWFGPALPDAAAFFEPGNAATDADAVLRGLSCRPVAAWCEDFGRSTTRRTWIEYRLSASAPSSSPRPRQRRSILDSISQGWVLVRRSIAIKASDRWGTSVLLAQAPIIAGLVAIVFGNKSRTELDHASWGSVAQAVATTTFLMALAAIWFGCSNAAREIVSERAIYRRERMVGMSLYAYLASKIVVMLGLCIVQCGMLQGIVSKACGLEGEPPRTFGILLLAAMTAVMVGLFVSAAVRSVEAASGVLPLVILPMVILGGILLPLPEMPGPTVLLADAMPSRWAFEGLFVPEAEVRPTIELPADDGVEILGETRVTDLAEGWFPVDGWRSGPDTPVWMLGVLCLLWLVAVRTIMVQHDTVGR
jgi:ABC-type multidrug transport system ATPase subunit/pSer/pThr/pTyr-binding forkhead associated (FHA) protein/ABC-type multidrug transport system permease subunit